MTDQTQFISEEPLFEEPPVFLSPQSAAEVTKAQGDQAKKKKKTLFLAAGALIFFFVIFSLLIVLKKKTPMITDPVQVQAPEQSQQETTAIQQRLDELQTDFDNSDPTKPDLPFPPISLDISLDPPARR
jgi:hypothetical protein